MKRLCLVALSLGLATNALATGRLAEISLIDRDSGQALPTYYHHGEYWVAGRPGARYSIRIHNTQERRLMGVTSVDGVNVITGATAGFLQSGYVFDAYQSFEIAGWRKSDAEVASFVFTALPDSYAARTGRPHNVGVIGVALFAERPLPPPPLVESQRYDERERDASGQAGAADSASPSPSAPAAKAEQAAGSDAGLAGRNTLKRAETRLGTGHGQREYSYVTQVEFERASDTPNEIIRIRYDSYANLVAMGVIPRPRPAWPTPEPFPDRRLGYVPDP